MPRFNLSWLYVIIAMSFAILYFSNQEGGIDKQITYTEFKDMINKGYANKIIAYDDNTVEMYIKPEFVKDVFKNDYKKVGRNPALNVEIGSMESLDKFMEKAQEEGHFTGSISYEKKRDYFGALFWNIAPFLLLIGIWMFAMRRMSGGAGAGGANPFNVGKSKAQVYEKGDKTNRITFKDVAGQAEAKQEVEEIVEFLKQPQKYTELGGKIPKGALLVGPPGTGKTLLAKAVAGEADVPFFSLSGSDFVEMFVGVGASRVRDLFRQAKEKAPCIIFIDEIDAIGRSRDSKYGGGNEEREQTLNQLLSEMDGFDSSRGILILGATNRPEILDKALLRPGRFDRQIIVDKPDLKGRVEILRVHAKDVLMDDTVDFDAIALATSGAVGSDLANMINEAAINAVKQGRDYVCQKDLFEAVEQVLVGKEKKDRIMSKEERRIVSYHEVGHALVSALQKNSEPVQKITIVPRTMGALGYVMQVPEEEKFLNTKAELHDMLVGLLAGRAAEEIVFDTVTTGASNDIEKATSIARAMVTQYGMSKKFGLIGLQTVESQYLDGRAVMNCSDVTAAEVDSEVMRILKECYEKALELLSGNRSVMDKIAEYLIEKETITGKEFMKIYRKEKGIPEPEENSTEETKSRISENARPEAAVNTQAADSSSESGAAPAVQEMPAGQKTQDNAEEEIVPKPWDLHFQQSQNTGSAADDSEARPSGEGQNKNTGSTGQSDWWNNSESGIPGQDLNFFHTQESGSGNPLSQQAEEDNTQQTSVSGGTTDSEEEKGNDDTSNGPRGPVGRFSNTVLPPSDKK